MNQRGFSSVVLLVLAVVVIGAGAVGYLLLQKPSTQQEPATAEGLTATTSPTATASNVTPRKNVSSKSRARACDVLSLSTMSSITGVNMAYTPDLTEDTKGYEDGGIWNSMCSYMQADGTVESNAGAVLMITEGISADAQAMVRSEFEKAKTENGGVAISGFGDKAFKVVSDGGPVSHNDYYVLVGNTMIWAYSAVGHGTMDGERPDYLSTENKDAQTEAMLKHVLSQLK